MRYSIMNGSKDRLAGLYDRQTLVLNRIQRLEADACNHDSDCAPLSGMQASQRDLHRQARDQRRPQLITLIYDWQCQAGMHYTLLMSEPAFFTAMQDACSTKDRLRAELRSKDIPHRFVRVPADYYECVSFMNHSRGG